LNEGYSPRESLRMSGRRAKVLTIMRGMALCHLHDLFFYKTLIGVLEQRTES
jgi:hypothetical protein